MHLFGNLASLDAKKKIPNFLSGKFGIKLVDEPFGTKQPMTICHPGNLVGQTIGRSILPVELLRYQRNVHLNYGRQIHR